MANYIATDTQFTATANAIRAKTGDSISIEWDASTGFADDIAAISGGGEVWAAISVTYPAGSVCTATNGTDALTASDTSGQVVFGIPEPASTPETWTVSCTDGINSNSETASISTYGQVETLHLAYADPVLNNNSWNTISAISLQGTGDTYWDIGDKKNIVINGNIGTRTYYNNSQFYVFILDFNHPINKTIADNNIIWGCFKKSDGTNWAFVDSKYGSYSEDGTYYYNYNHNGNSKTGGWKNSQLRYDILGGTSSRNADATQNTIDTPVSGTFLAALPSDLRSVIRLWNRYIDSQGTNSSSDSYCNTPTVDAVTLLAEFEVFGIRTRANTYEQNHQKQLAYYANGNSKDKYRNDYDSKNSCIWWLASTSVVDTTSICCVSSGSLSDAGARNSRGLAPAFRT